MYTINAFLPLIRAAAAKSTAKVITLSSGAGDTEFTLKGKFARGTPYSVSKAAFNMVNVKYASEFVNEDILFLAISPGFVNTATKPRESFAFSFPPQDLGRLNGGFRSYP